MKTNSTFKFTSLCITLWVALQGLAPNLTHAATYSALGASDATSYGASTLSNGYVYRIADWLKLNYGPWTLRNHGVNGYTAPDIQNNALGPAISDNPQLVTLWVGGNDVKDSVFSNEPTAVLEARFREAYTTIVRRLRNETAAYIVTANLPDLSRIPVAKFLNDAQKQLAQADSIALNRVIADVNSTYNVPTVDLYNDPNSYEPANFYDGFHPNDAGYALLAQKFEAVIGPALNRHRLSGQVTDNSGAGLPGTTIGIIHNGSKVSVLSDNTGKFSFSDFGSGTYVLTPIKSGYTFAPASRTATLGTTGITTMNFTGTSTIRYTISGMVNTALTSSTGSRKPLANIPVFLVNRANLPGLIAATVNPTLLSLNSNNISRTITSSTGTYSFSTLSGSYYVVPIKSGLYFNPVTQAITVTNANVRDRNFGQVGTDTIAPTITALTVNSTATTVSGTAVDDQSGIFTAVLTLQNASGQYLNWSSLPTIQFTSSPTATSYKLAINPNLSRVATQKWAVTLPANLPPGNYQLNARAIDRSFRVSPPVLQTLTKRGATATIAPLVAITLSTATASVMEDNVQLKFTAALDAASASDATHYTVTVNGKTVMVESAGYNAVTHSVTLALPLGTLHPEDGVTVAWNDLQSASTLANSGQTGPIIAH
ncbi:MAG: carboxypeptidase regulatory-like domain-containing protein [Abitibacteriaceae bacterium]|nr:carboxypeptidase regulatory-like domain-containing protein [Abditibacteriaceae bacterium]